MKILIIGGGTAGTEVAWRLRQRNKDAEITILEKSGYVQYSPCALPYAIGGEIKNFDEIFLFDRHFYEYNKITLNSGCLAKKIDKKNKKVVCEKNGKTEVFGYDRLVIAVGAKTDVPAIRGLDACPYFKLKTVDDAKRIKNRVKAEEKAAIIGAGHIGVELADALRLLGLRVALLEGQNHLLPIAFDSEISSKIQSFMEEKGVEVIASAEIEEIKPGEIRASGKTIGYDHLFICCGVKPDIELAKNAGLKCERGIIVDDYGRTSDKNIYACGDLVESVNFIDNRKVLSQLATTAVKQAKTVAENILGGKSKNDGVLNTSISKFGPLIFGSCGVSQEYCRFGNLKAVAAFYSGKTKAEYYPGGRDIFVKIIALPSGRLIGCQIAGYEDVAGRLNMAALAIKQKLSLEEFISGETCYNPAVAPIFDPLILASEICLKKIKIHNESAELAENKKI